MRGATQLSAHRFRDAIETARRAAERRPRDEWNHGVRGDGHLELGEYDEAFDAFDLMVDARSGAGVRARGVCARAARRSRRARDAMRLAADATSPHDPESQAWHMASSGISISSRPRSISPSASTAARSSRFQITRPRLPAWHASLSARRRSARDRDLRSGSSGRRRQQPWLRSSDPYAAAGTRDDRSGTRSPSRSGNSTRQNAKLAVFLADRGRNLDEALATVGRRRDAPRHLHDRRAGVDPLQARAAAQEAGDAMTRRSEPVTRSPDPHHAAAIAFALGDTDAARAHLRIAAAGNLRFDVRLAQAAASLMADLDAKDRVARR
jgi:tetratricopeptide (TPR) repeat protein